MSVAGPPQDANWSPSGGSAAAEAASVGAHIRVAGPPQDANWSPSGGSAAAEAASVGAHIRAAGPSPLSTAERLPLPMRRTEVQRRVTAQRMAIGDAWAEFENAVGKGETKVRRVIAWTRRASALAALLAATVAIRRLARGGIASGVLGALALAGSATRLINLTRRSSSPQNAREC